MKNWKNFVTTFYYNSSGQTRVDKRRGEVCREGGGGRGRGSGCCFQSSLVQFCFCIFIICIAVERGVHAGGSGRHSEL